MPYNGLSQPIPIKLLLALSSARSPKNLSALAFSNLAQRLDPATEAPAPAWLHTKGLSALLEAAKDLPPREPWDLANLDPEDATGLTKLLIEARQRHAAHHQGG